MTPSLALLRNLFEKKYLRSQATLDAIFKG